MVTLRGRVQRHGQGPVDGRRRLLHLKILGEAMGQLAELEALAAALRSWARLGQAGPIQALLRVGPQGIQVIRENVLVWSKQRREDVDLDAVGLGPRATQSDSFESFLSGSELLDAM